MFTIDEKIPDFKYLDLYGEHDSYLSDLKSEKTILIFLRYFGCTVCSLQLLELSENIKAFKDKDVDVNIVLQSKVSTIEKQELMDLSDMKIILDPEEKLYKLFDISTVTTKEELGGEKTVNRVVAAKERGLSHGEYEGNEMQLPATFILDKYGKIEYVHYGKEAADTPTVDELLKLI